MVVQQPQMLVRKVREGLKAYAGRQAQLTMLIQQRQLAVRVSIGHRCDMLVLQ